MTKGPATKKTPKSRNKRPRISQVEFLFKDGHANRSPAYFSILFLLLKSHLSYNFSVNTSSEL